MCISFSTETSSYNLGLKKAWYDETTGIENLILTLQFFFTEFVYTFIKNYFRHLSKTLRAI